VTLPRVVYSDCKVLSVVCAAGGATYVDPVIMVIWLLVWALNVLSIGSVDKMRMFAHV
jgi:hypothetical protein